jgi:tetratricopeptide (TPR) repeat protein
MRLVHRDYEAALDLYNRAITDDPYLRDAYLHRGIAYRGLGDPERALADIDHALRLDPVFGRAVTERARAKVDLIAARANGDRDKLAEAFGPTDPLGVNVDLDRAVNLDGLSGDGKAVLLRGAVRLIQQRDGEAQQDFDRFLRRRPKAGPDLEAAIAKWKQERPVFDSTPLDELSRVSTPRR